MIERTLGHYCIVAKLGEGGMGVVYKARDIVLDRFVALKILSAAAVVNPEHKQRFILEAKTASALNHPNIVTIHEIAEAEGELFIIMEYVSGKTLDQIIRNRKLTLNQALGYAVQIADGLAAAHARGIIHRDLKPGNIMLNDEGLVKVLDFGLAKSGEPARLQGEETLTLGRTKPALTEEGKILGTVSYMSPEQAQGKPLDYRSDIFSFGTVLYEMLTGRRAFQGETKFSTLAAIVLQEPRPATEIVHDLPHELKRALATSRLNPTPEGFLRRWHFENPGFISHSSGFSVSLPP